MSEGLGRQIVAALVALTVAGIAAAGAVLLFAPGMIPERLFGADRTGAAAAGAQAPDGTLHLTAVGDFGATSETGDVLDRIKEIDPDLNLALGDLSYGEPGGEDEWCAMVREHIGPDLPFELLAGNHESDGSDGHIDEFAKCLPTQLTGLVGTYGRQWYADVPAEDPLVRLVMISSGLAFDDGYDEYTADSEEYRWTAEAIDGARAAAIPWVVVGLHKPCVSMEQYECDPGTALQDLLVSKKVDLVLHGHEHLYQRTHQLALGADCPGVTTNAVDAECIVDRDTELVQGAGTVFTTVGTGGVELREVRPDDTEAGYFATSSGSQTPSWGVLDVTLTPTTLTAAFAATAGGTFEDRFTITGPGPAAP